MSKPELTAARRALAAYRNGRECIDTPVWDVSDLVTDLLHLADTFDLEDDTGSFLTNGEEVLHRARRDYSAEAVES